MAENNPKVKGILYGTHQRYLQQDIDPDMLYWITDKGLLIRGDTIVTPTKFIDITPPSSGNGSYTFTIEAYEADPTSPTQYSFEVYTKAAVNTLIDGLQTAINSHVNKTATDQVLGHVKLSDATDDLTHDAATGGMAATPKAVASVRSELIEYVDNQIGNLSTGMTFKGTYGLPADNPDEDDPLDEIAASVGDMYICISTNMTGVHYHDSTGAAITNGTLDYGDQIICVQAATVTQGTVTTPAYWTIVANTASNAVTTSETLTSGQLIVGNGNKTVKKLTGGSAGNFLRRLANGSAQWQVHTNLEHGIAYGVCETLYEIASKSVAIPGYEKKKYGIVSICFTGGVNRGDTLTVTDGLSTPVDSVPIVYHGALVGEGIIEKGDTATLMFVDRLALDEREIEAWVVISIDRAPNNTPTNLSAFTNDIQALLVCTTAGNNNSKTITNSNVTIKTGSVFAVRFSNAVGAGSTLNINATGAKLIKHRNVAIAAYQIRETDTATFIYDGTAYHVLAIDRAFDTAPTEGHHNLVDSDAIYNFVMSQVLYWRAM